MNETEARAYGRKVRRVARAAVEAGDCGTVVLNADWQVGDKSYELGIVDTSGVVNVNGEVATAFKRGFNGR
jgi:hypothetical protein